MGISEFENRTELKHSPITVFKQKIADTLDLTLKQIEDSGATKLHEFFGAFILKLIPDELKGDKDVYFQYFEKCLSFAEKIFLVADTQETPLPYELSAVDPHQIILSLHRIISSDIDADRLVMY